MFCGTCDKFGHIFGVLLNSNFSIVDLLGKVAEHQSIKTNKMPLTPDNSTT